MPQDSAPSDTPVLLRTLPHVRGALIWPEHGSRCAVVEPVARENPPATGDVGVPPLVRRRTPTAPRTAAYTCALRLVIPQADPPGRCSRVRSMSSDSSPTAQIPGRPQPLWHATRPVHPATSGSRPPPPPVVLGLEPVCPRAVSTGSPTPEHGLPARQPQPAPWPERWPGPRGRSNADRRSSPPPAAPLLPGDLPPWPNTVVARVP